MDEASKRTHVVAQGECLARIAARYAIRDWKRVWDAPENEPLRAERKSPNVLLPGDHILVPGRKIHEIVWPTDQMHRVVISTQATIELVLVFRDDEGQPLAGTSYELTHAAFGPDVGANPLAHSSSGVVPMEEYRSGHACTRPTESYCKEFLQAATRFRDTNDAGGQDPSR